MKKSATGSKAPIFLIIALMLFILSVSLPANSAVNPPGPGRSGGEECGSCHKPPHPAIRGSLQHPDGECLLCHNEGEIPDEIVKQALRPVIRNAEEHPGGALSEMVIVPAGEFIMGEDYVKKAVGPKHKAYLDTYQIDRFDVTNGEFEAFVRATGRKPPKHWIDSRVLSDKRYHPVTFVSWFDAEAFCEWKGKRLPTEMEWEKAARGTDGRIFPWGNEFVREYANVYILGIGDTTPVGRFEKGKSPYGLYDMAGNVFQWTLDWFKAYPNNRFPDNPNYGETHKVLRGGSFYDCSYYKCGPSFQTFNRIALSPRTVSVSIGFRCAKNASNLKM